MGPRHFSRGIKKDVHILRDGMFASMGPRHFSRGIGLARHLPVHHPLASMGPRHFSRGIMIALLPFWTVGDASMGPRHFSRGIIVPAYLTKNQGQLQWGRGISAAEFSHVWLKRHQPPGFNGAAAFQPRN